MTGPRSVTPRLPLPLSYVSGYRDVVRISLMSQVHSCCPVPRPVDQPVPSDPTTNLTCTRNAIHAVNRVCTRVHDGPRHDPRRRHPSHLHSSRLTCDLVRSLTRQLAQTAVVISCCSIVAYGASSFQCSQKENTSIEPDASLNGWMNTTCGEQRIAPGIFIIFTIHAVIIFLLRYISSTTSRVIYPLVWICGTSGACVNRLFHFSITSVEYIASCHQPHWLNANTRTGMPMDSVQA
jgi:hypothetical protein